MERVTRNVTNDLTTGDVVQFTCPIYFVEENEGKIVIDIMRMGKLQGSAQVDVYTEDGSGKAGARYEAFSQVVSFGPGDYTKTVTVGIVQSDEWAPTLEFKVKMDGPKGCDLGKYLKTCRVKVIDNDSFPSSKYKEELRFGEEGINRIRGPALFVEFWKLAFRNKGLRWRTLLSLLLDQMTNCYMYFTLIAKAYLVNVVFNLHSHQLHGSQRTALARLIGVGYIAPMMALHIWDYAKVGMDIQGRARLWIQESVFRKYLNFSTESLLQVSHARIQNAITQDAGVLADGYVAVLEMVAMLGKLAITIIFMLNSDPGSLWVLVTMPCIMLVCAILRRYVECPCGRSGSVDPEASWRELEKVVAETCRNYNLVADYLQRPRVNEHFSNIAQKGRENKIPKKKKQLNDSYIPKWLGPIFIGIYVTLSAEAVIKGLRVAAEGGSADDDEGGTISLGVFIATIGIFTDVSEMFSDLYQKLLSVSELFDPLRQITFFLNLTTELDVLKSVNRQRREETKKLRDEVMGKPEPSPESGLVKTDLLPIKVIEMSFKYDGLADDDWLFRNVNLSVNQGNLIALVGAHGTGKTTFLRLLGQRVFPTEGSIYFPSHLRALYVCQDPVIMSTIGPLENLTYGLGGDAMKNADKEYIKAVLKELKMGATLKLIEKAEEMERRRSNGSSFKDPPSMRVQSRDSQDSREMVFNRGGLQSSNARSPVKHAGYIQLARTETIEDEVEEPKNVFCCCKGGQEDEEEGENCFLADWPERLTYTEKVKMTLARAFLMNPAILMLNRPLKHVDFGTAKSLLNVLKAHTKNRGIGLSMHDKNNRRPRTVIYIPESVDQTPWADIVWQIDGPNRAVNVVENRQGMKDGFEINWRNRHSVFAGQR